MGCFAYRMVPSDDKLAALNQTGNIYSILVVLKRQSKINKSKKFNFMKHFLTI